LTAQICAAKLLNDAILYDKIRYIPNPIVEVQQMNLGHINRGTKLKLFQEVDGRPVSEEYEATFRYYESGKLFTIYCRKLYENYENFDHGAKFGIGFSVDMNGHSFVGTIVEKQRSNGMLLLEQLSDIITINRREYDRDELRIKVMVYGLPESKLGSSYFIRPEVEADLIDTTYDVSAGGLCVISNQLLRSEHDPYYLTDFSLGTKDTDWFKLPAILVRRSNYPSTRVGKYDYGFKFLFDNLPKERSRLSRSILNRKISFR